MKTKNLFIVVIILAILFFSYDYVKNNINKNEMNNKSVVEVFPVSHASVVLKWGDVVVYADPVGDEKLYQDKYSPSIILITDIHGDHFSTTTLEKILGDAILIVPQAVRDILPPELSSKVLVLNNDESFTEQGIEITTIPMYNLPESNENFHTKGRGNGYVLEKDNFRVYIAGDTSGIPEMRALKDIDIAFIPMNLPYTMSVEEAADAVLEFKPKQVYPYHYRGQGGLSDINKFMELVNIGDPSIEVSLEDWYSETN